MHCTCSWLSRAIETAWLVLDELDLLWLPIIKTWRLNERYLLYSCIHLTPPPALLHYRLSATCLRLVIGTEVYILHLYLNLYLHLMSHRIRNEVQDSSPYSNKYFLPPSSLATCLLSPSLHPSSLPPSLTRSSLPLHCTYLTPGCTAL